MPTNGHKSLTNSYLSAKEAHWKGTKKLLFALWAERELATLASALNDTH
jgi:hypothetical protein